MSSSTPSFPSPRDLFISNARLIDGTGAPPCSSTSILIRDGKIEGIGLPLQANDVPLLDVAGATVMPGLIDAHVHLQCVPGSAYRKDEEERLREARYHHLRAYLASGVTTVLDAAIAAPVLREIQDYLNSGGVGPRVMALAPALYPPGGYLDNGFLTPFWEPMWRPAGTIEDIGILFSEYAGIPNIVGLKMFIEPGFGPFAHWPIHSPSMRTIIRDQAAAHGLPIYVHSTSRKAHEIGLEMGAHALMHGGFPEGVPPEDFIRQGKAQGTYLVTTLLGMLDGLLPHRSFLEDTDDPLFTLTVPEDQLASARDPKAWRSMWDRFYEIGSPPWLPDAVRKLFRAMIPVAFDQRVAQHGLQRTRNALLALHRAGVPIVTGTDAGNWPGFVNCFHGPSTIREMQMLAEAGLPPGDVLASATSVPSQMMGLQDKIGSVEVGKEADLIVVQDDPLEDLSALRRILWTIKNGEARRPADWMQA